jgi:hypothetical protein
MRSVAREVLPVCFSLASALALAGAIRADYPESFKAGIRAKDFGRWYEVASAMRQAIAQQSRATGENVRIYGNRVEPYIPHYFLGLALFRQGDWAAAAEAFQEAQKQGTTRGLYHYRMGFYQEVCSRHLEGLRPSALPRPRAPSPSVLPVDPGAADPIPRVMRTEEVRREMLEKTEREGREWLKRCTSILRTLKARSRVDPVTLAVAEERLETAAFQLDGCRREGDLEGAARAAESAHLAYETLEDLAKGS